MPMSVIYSTSKIVFACHSKACAPPPAGTGGSRNGGGGARGVRAAGGAAPTTKRTRLQPPQAVSDEAERAGNRLMAAEDQITRAYKIRAVDIGAYAKRTLGWDHPHVKEFQLADKAVVKAVYKYSGTDHPNLVKALDRSTQALDDLKKSLALVARARGGKIR